MYDMYNRNTVLDREGGGHSIIPYKIKKKNEQNESRL